MAGAGYKLFNTGDVLTAAQVNTYLMEQTVMVFADAAARTAALSGVVSEGMISYLKDTNAVEVYNGSAWVASDDPNAIQNTIVDAKGDLIAASANDTPARLAVGNNGETLLADSAATTGLRWSAQPAASNPVINSAMQIWQRGTSFSVTSGSTSYLTADRWQAYSGAAGMTITRQTTSDATNLPNIQYCLRAARDSGNTGTAARSVFQNFESVNSIPFAGKTVTISFYARKGANFTPTTFLVQLISGTGTDQNVINGYTGAADVISQSVTPTTTWARYSYSGTVPTNSTELSPYFSWSPTGTAGAADYLEITGVQIDVGSVALPFRTQGVTLAGELALAQRYYYRIRGDEGASGTNNMIGVGVAYNAAVCRVPIRFPVKMRIAPSYSSSNSASYFTLAGNSASTGYATTTLDFASPDAANIDVSSASVTAGYAYWFRTNNASAFIDFSAEL